MVPRGELGGGGGKGGEGGGINGGDKGGGAFTPKKVSSYPMT
tara:strand:- start:253 stop:378 length:126 start_codon:yes stop_codon:yes gene_type:complete